MYEVMVFWKTLHPDFAEIWRAADKIVYSKTLETVSGARLGSSETLTLKRSGS